MSNIALRGRPTKVPILPHTTASVLATGGGGAEASKAVTGLPAPQGGAWVVWLPCPVRENAWEGVKWPVLKLPLEHTIPHL